MDHDETLLINPTHIKDHAHTDKCIDKAIENMVEGLRFPLDGDWFLEVPEELVIELCDLREDGLEELTEEEEAWLEGVWEEAAKAAVEDAYEQHEERRDPYAYFGVSRRDFW